MEKLEYIQRGENPAFPETIKVWSKSSNTNPPSWLTDKCKVVEITDEGIYKLATRNYSNGSYDYMSPEMNVVVSGIESDDSYICIGDFDKYRKDIIFSLNKKQLNLLYKNK